MSLYGLSVSPLTDPGLGQKKSILRDKFNQNSPPNCAFQLCSNVVKVMCSGYCSDVHCDPSDQHYFTTSTLTSTS